MSKVKLTLTLGLLATLTLSAGFWFAFTRPASAQTQSNAPELNELDNSKSELRSVIERYVVDRGSLTRVYPVESSPGRQARFKQFYADWLAQIGKLNFDAMSLDGKVDYVLFRNHLEHELKQREIESKALEHVKNKYVEPGKQPEMIKGLALEAIEYVEKNNFVTVPPLAREDWGMEMLSPERQLVSPFFLGGADILVSYPTNTMAHEQKMMSLRGNNPHFSRATVHHELIPGHHLQQFMMRRYKAYRGLFATPFWHEGNSLYWELLLWDRGFPKTPEDKLGMLFWRAHRGARIVFSLSFHLEKMTPQECIDLLVNRVGHEVDNATAAVRRSFDGSYKPLYQAAYLLGGLQFYSLHKDLVGGGKMTDKVFHDTILKENGIPVEMVRAILTKQKLTRDFKTNWKFYGQVTAP